VQSEAFGGQQVLQGTTPRRPRCAFVGDGPLLITCAEQGLADGFPVVLIATDGGAVSTWATAAGIDVVPAADGLADALRSHRVDVLFSVVNLRMLPPAVLAAVPLAVNFHDGPLPTYAGLHVTTWALLAGERRHGVAWHVVAKGIDTGPIVAEASFPVATDDTAYTLNTRCFEAGLETFGAVLAAVAAPQLVTRAQGTDSRRVFLRHQRPGATGLLDPRRTADDLGRTVRALDLGGRVDNPVGVVRLVVGDRAWLVLAAHPRPSTTGVGFGALRLDGDVLLLATADGDLAVTALAELDGRPADLAAVAGTLDGTVLAVATGLAEALDALDTPLARHEASVTGVLANAEPVALPVTEVAEDGAGWSVVALPFHGVLDLADAVGVAGSWLARVAGVRTVVVGVVDQLAAESMAALSPLLAPPVVSVSLDEPDAVRASVTEALDRGPWLVDLLARRPGLTGVAPPLLTLEGAAVDRPASPGEVLRLRFGASGATLHHRVDRVPAADAERFAGQLATALGAAVVEPLRGLNDLPILGPADDALLEALNATAVDHHRHRTVWDDVRDRLAAGADEPMLSSGLKTLDGTRLAAEIDGLRGALVAAGIGRGDRVGITVPRGVDLVVAVLATLAAGAAYVPLDPTYPDDRLGFMAADAGLSAIVAHPAASARFLPPGCALVEPDAREPVVPTPPAARAGPEDLAYVIYTSGSTGRPKGVMIEHRQVMSFFVGMDAVIDHDPAGTWLAVTSLSFDISVLELLWALSRGFHVVIAPDGMATGATSTAPPSPSTVELAPTPGPVGVSLFYFAAGDQADGYRLLLDGARFADRNGLAAVWTPERHFHDFGGPYPNPAVTGAAIAAVTERVGIRAGSCVLPLHSPVRVAEEWSMVDNLSRGRVGVSFAAGWQPDDFVLNPGAYADAKARLSHDLDVVRRLWRGETVSLPGPRGDQVDVRTMPRPVQLELPVWLTSAGTRATFETAGTIGAGVLTHLLGQQAEELAANIAAYRKAWAEAGRPGDGYVTLMIHTFVDDDEERVRSLVREPLGAYLRTSVGLIKDMASAFPTFTGAGVDADQLLASLSPVEMDDLVEMAVERYSATSGLIGTPQQVATRATELAGLGVDELACLIDFGIATDDVLASLPHLARLQMHLGAAAAAGTTGAAPEHAGVAELVARHGVTHLQCTPSHAAMLAADPADAAALATIHHLLVGGEVLPASLAAELRHLLPHGRLTNMYGPTETTIWSLTHEIDTPPTTAVPIGRPIANTTVAVVDGDRRTLPPGCVGELVIGGEGVARGYHGREELTAARFVDVDGLGRAYLTGDLASIGVDGVTRFHGRVDHQVKVRGHRVELGEIEAVLVAHPAVGRAVAVVRPGGTIVAYVIAGPGPVPDESTLRAHAAASLPEVMVPNRVVAVQAFPHTPNGKLDRAALPAPLTPAATPPSADPQRADDDHQQLVASVWAEVLDAPFGLDDSFFDVGGHSLAAVMVFRRLLEATGSRLALTDVFRFPTVRSFAAHLDRVGSTLAVGVPTTDPRSGAASGAPVAGVERGLRRRQARAGRTAPAEPVR